MLSMAFVAATKIITCCFSDEIFWQTRELFDSNCISMTVAIVDRHPLEFWSTARVTDLMTENSVSLIPHL